MVYTLTRVSVYKASRARGGRPFPGAATVLPSLQCSSSPLRSSCCFSGFFVGILGGYLALWVFLAFHWQAAIKAAGRFGRGFISTFLSLGSCLGKLLYTSLP